MKIVVIRSEQDISNAQAMAKSMCESARMRSFASQRVAMLVSDLARNIARDTPGAAIELSLDKNGDVKVALQSLGIGTGIVNLDEVLSGKYRRR